MSGERQDPEQIIRDWLSDSVPDRAPASLRETLDAVTTRPAGSARPAGRAAMSNFRLAGSLAAAVAVLVLVGSSAYLYGSARPTSPGQRTSAPPTSTSTWPTPRISVATTATETPSPTSPPPSATITQLTGSSWTLVDGALPQITNTAAGAYQQPVFALPSGGFIAIVPTSAGETRAFESADGLAWHEVAPLPTSDAVVRDVVESAGTIIAVGLTQGMGPALDSAMVWTFDGQTWDTKELSAKDGSTANRVAAGPAGFLISGAGSAGFELWSSADGATWNPVVESGIPFDTDQPVLLGNAKGYSAFQLFNPRVWHSTDGAHWTETYHAPALTETSSYYMGPIIKTADGGYRSFGGIYTGTGMANATPEDMAIWTSPDMTHWTMSATVKAIGFPGLFVNGGVAPIAGGFAAAGTQPLSLATRGPLAAWTSRDGKSWQKLAGLPSFPDSLVLEVAGDGTHVVVAFVDGQEHFELLVGAGLN